VHVVVVVVVAAAAAVSIVVVTVVVLVAVVTRTFGCFRCSFAVVVVTVVLVVACRCGPVSGVAVVLFLFLVLLVPSWPSLQCLSLSLQCLPPGRRRRCTSQAVRDPGQQTIQEALQVMSSRIGRCVACRAPVWEGRGGLLAFCSNGAAGGRRQLIVVQLLICLSGAGSAFERPCPLLQCQGVFRLARAHVQPTSISFLPVLAKAQALSNRQVFDHVWLQF
jgi:hypothetical protein